MSRYKYDVEVVTLILILVFLVFYCTVVYFANHDTPPKPPQIEINFSETEKQAAEVMCRARIFEAVINERIRLTGRPNPQPLEGPVQ